MAKTIVGMYEHMDDARKAIEDLVSHGFRREDISLVAKDTTGEFAKHLESERGTKDTGRDVGTGAGIGAGAGAVLGGLGGLLVGLGLIAIPGIGPLLAAGAVATTLAGAGIGAVAGGLIGALVGLGIPEDEAQVYARGIEEGSTLVIVNTSDEMANQAADIMNRYNPIDVERQAAEWGIERREAVETGMEEPTRMEHIEQEPSRMEHMEEREEATIPVIEEELAVGKREVPSGGVRVHSYVQEQPVQEQVTLREERVDVERRPVDRPASEQDWQRAREGTVEVTETREEAVAEKRARVVEEVDIDKEVAQREETIEDTLRRTDVEVERTGAERTTGRAAVSGEDAFFRNHFQSTYGTSGFTYDQFGPYYTYGYDLGTSERYRNRTWQDVEPEFQRDFERRYPNARWNEYREAIRVGWERARSNR